MFPSPFILMLRLTYVVAMTGEEVEYLGNVPEDLPPLDDIVKTCTSAGSRFYRDGVCIKVAGKPRFWTKYGDAIIKGEGLTQAHVANIVNADLESVVRVPEVYVIFSRKEYRFIVMEFVEGTTFENRKSADGRYDRGEIGRAHV